MTCSKCNDTGEIWSSDFNCQSDSYEPVCRYCDCEIGKKRHEEETDYLLDCIPDWY